MAAAPFSKVYCGSNTQQHEADDGEMSTDGVRGYGHTAAPADADEQRTTTGGGSGSSSSSISSISSVTSTSTTTFWQYDSTTAEDILGSSEIVALADLVSVDDLERLQSIVRLHPASMTATTGFDDAKCFSLRKRWFDAAIELWHNCLVCRYYAVVQCTSVLS
jgi:hypothetical protein